MYQRLVHKAYNLKNKYNSGIIRKLQLLAWYNRITVFLDFYTFSVVTFYSTYFLYFCIKDRKSGSIFSPCVSIVKCSTVFLWVQNKPGYLIKVFVKQSFDMEVQVISSVTNYTIKLYDFSTYVVHSF